MLKRFLNPQFCRTLLNPNSRANPAFRVGAPSTLLSRPLLRAFVSIDRIHEDPQLKRIQQIQKDIESNFFRYISTMGKQPQFSGTLANYP